MPLLVAEVRRLRELVESVDKHLWIALDARNNGGTEAVTTSQMQKVRALLAAGGAS